MADPFEVRLRFMSFLTHLSASTTSSQKTASFALKHRDMDEDLHSCILESLDAPSTSMNSRANIMYFLDHFCEVAGKTGGEGHTPYVDMVRRDIGKIVVGVVGRGGGGGAGNANIKVARKVMETLRVRGVLGEELVSGIEGDLKEREREGGDEDAVMDRQGKEKERRHELKDKDRDRDKDKRDARSKDAKSNGHHAARVDKRAIEQRIEEDRERNKRLRESVWAVTGNDEDELDRLWEETSDLCEDDYVIAREEAEERAQFARYHKALLQEAAR